MDETYIKIKGRWHYLYRAIDADGLTLDIWLRKKRDTQAAYAFLKRLHNQFGEPKAIVTDKAPSLGSAFRKLQCWSFECTDLMLPFAYKCYNIRLQYCIFLRRFCQ